MRRSTGLMPYSHHQEVRSNSPTRLQRPEKNLRPKNVERVCSEVGWALLGAEAPDGDVGFLLRPEVVEAFRRIIPKSRLGTASAGRSMTPAFARDWGFDLTQISVPVLLTYGTLDTSCPPAHGRFLAAAVPTGIVIEVAEGGPSRGPRAEVLATHRWLRLGGVQHTW